MPALSFASNERGAVAVFVALGLTAMMSAAALGIDYGGVVVAKRRAQGAVDVAATVAAAHPAQADALARRSLADNGYAAGAVITVQPGAYAGDAKVAVGARFTPGAAQVNATRVRLQTTTRTFFAPVVGLAAEVPISATGTAASAQFAAFTIGSGLASLDSGIANAILGAMLGQPLTLSVGDYNALLTTKIDGFRFLDAIALSLNLQVASYNDVADATATIGQVVYALQVASSGAPGGAGAGLALGQITNALRGGGHAPVRVGQVIDLGDAAALAPGIGSRGPLVGVMDTLSDAVAIANGRRQIAVDLGPSIPGLLRTQITLAVGERRQSSGWVQPGNPNATVTTAQTRALIEASLSLPLGLGSITLPIYAQAGYARATLRSVTCPWSDQTRRQVTLDAQPGLAELAIADVPKTLIDPVAATPDLNQPASLLRVPPALTVTGRARLTLGSPNAQAVTFTDDDITRRSIRSVSSFGLTQSAVTGLISSLSLTANGLGILAPGLVTGALATALGAVAPALDRVLDSTLRVVGVRIGTADLTVDGTRCDQAVLVQ